MYVLGLPKRRTPGCVNSSGKAGQKWLARAETKFTEPGARLLANPVRVQIQLGLFLSETFNWYMQRGQNVCIDHTGSSILSNLNLDGQHLGLLLGHWRPRTEPLLDSLREEHFLSRKGRTKNSQEKLRLRYYGAFARPTTAVRSPLTTAFRLGEQRPESTGMRAWALLGQLVAFSNFEVL